MRNAAITGWGMAVPDRVLTNADLERMVETSDEWITSRTGIKERRIVGPNDSTTSLAVSAARQALEKAELTPEDIDLIVVATCTPDQFLVSQACLVQAELGGAAGAFDLGARRAVAVPMDLRPLDERVFRHERVELRAVDEMVVATVHLVGARLTRRVRHAEAQGRKFVPQFACERRFPSTAW